MTILFPAYAADIVTRIRTAAVLLTHATVF